MRRPAPPCALQLASVVDPSGYHLRLVEPRPGDLADLGGFDANKRSGLGKKAQPWHVGGLAG